MSETERDPRLCGRLERAFDRSAGMPSGIAVVLVGLGLAGAWTATYLAGGSRTVLPHAFYLVIIVAAGRFGWPGAVLAGGAAGLLAGPLMPLDVDAGTAQLAVAWWGRMMAFLLVGLLVAWLTSRSRGSIVDRVRDARSAGELRQALRKGQFELHYQPLVDLESREILGFEALCRRRDPIAGLVGPGDFIPVAERTGVIVPIGEFVLHQAVRQVAAWNREGHTYGVAVNVSARQLGDARLVDHVAAALRDANLDAGLLTVEVTETAVIADFPTALERLRDLRRLGVRIAVDDFGTGQSSLSYLHRLPIDVIKIDRQFVAEVLLDHRSAAMVTGIIQLARALGAEVIAEGVEQQDEVHALRALGCTIGQGYHLGRPAPAATVALLLSNTPGTREHRAVRRPPRAGEEPSCPTVPVDFEERWDQLQSHVNQQRASRGRPYFSQSRRP